MDTTTSDPLLDALLDSWDRNNRILVNLLRAMPESALALRGTPDSQCLVELFMHIHRCRLYFVGENAPDIPFPTPPAPDTEDDRERIVAHLNESAIAVREAVASRIRAKRPMAVRYDNPLLMLQHNLWHEGYHHGQMKLILKQHGMALADDTIGPETWGLWMQRTA